MTEIIQVETSSTQIVQVKSPQLTQVIAAVPTVVNITTPAKVYEIGETPSGVINGSNATFIAAFNFIPESVQPYLNGIRQRLVDDFTTSGSTTILFAISPQIGDTILIDYQRA